MLCGEKEVIFVSEKSKKWLKAAAVRAIKTMAQSAIGVIGASVVLSEVDWIVVLSSALLAAVVSLLTSVAGLPEVEQAKEGAE